MVGVSRTSVVIHDLESAERELVTAATAHDHDEVL